MKKIFLALLLSFCLIFTLTACSGGSSSTEEDTSNEEDIEFLEEPVSDATDDSGLPGTWVDDSTDDTDISEYMTLAINTDDTFSLYLEASTSDNAFGQLTADGTYKVDGSKITFEFEDDAVATAGDEEATPEMFKSGDQFDYKLDGDTLTLTKGDETMTFERVPVGDEETETTTEETETDSGTTTETETTTEAEESTADASK